MLVLFLPECHRFPYYSSLHTHTSPVMHPDGTIWNLMDIVQSLCNRLRRTLRVAKSSPRAKGGRAGEAFYCRSWGSTDARKKEKRLLTYYLGPLALGIKSRTYYV